MHCPIPLEFHFGRYLAAVTTFTGSMAYFANFGDTSKIFPFPDLGALIICYANLTYSQLFTVLDYGMSTALPKVSEDTAVIQDQRTLASQSLLSMTKTPTGRISACMIQKTRRQVTCRPGLLPAISNFEL
jgi:hypothetical protein